MKTSVISNTFIEILYYKNVHKTLAKYNECRKVTGFKIALYLEEPI